MFSDLTNSEKLFGVIAIIIILYGLFNKKGKGSGGPKPPTNTGS